MNFAALARDISHIAAQIVAGIGLGLNLLIIADFQAYFRTLFMKSSQVRSSVFIDDAARRSA